MSLWYVKIRFSTSRSAQSYMYLVEGEQSELAKMTHAVVDAPSSGLTIVKIDSFDEVDRSTYTGEYKYVVTLFNFDTYRDRVERQARKKVVEERIRKRISKKQFIDNAAILLDGGPEGQKLLEEWHNL